MPAPLILHVGLPRAGTRHLRTVLGVARHELAAAGVLAPEPVRTAHVDVPLEARLGAYLEPTLHQLRLRLAGHRGTAVLSLEQLALADVRQARQVLDRLDVDPARTTVVVTARDLGRALSARWQADVELGSTLFFDPYLHGLVATRRDGAVPPALDLPTVVSRWGAVVGPERVAVVTVPRHGMEPGLLWARFAAATGLPADLPGSLDRALAEGPPAHADDVPLSASQVQLLRTVNAALRAGGHPVRLQQALRARLIAIWQGLDATAPQQLTVPEPLRAEVRAWAATDVARLHDQGVRVFGQLTDLDPLFGPGGADQRPVDDSLGRDVVALLLGDRLGALPDRRPTGKLRAWATWRRRELRPAGAPFATGSAAAAGPRRAVLPAPRVSDSPAGGLALGATLDVRGGADGADTSVPRAHRRD